MTTALPEAPAALEGAPRAFYDELLRMLSVVQPMLDEQESWAKFDRKGVEVNLVHAERTDWAIWATVGKRDAIAGTSWAHEHFFAPDEGDPEPRPWTTEIVDFVAEILRGEIETETTFRGGSVLSVRHFNRDEHGERKSLGRTVFLPPARLLIWLPKRVERERMSFL
jgi:hypothetical protein